MRAFNLLREASAKFDEYELYPKTEGLSTIFSDGAKWMHHIMEKLRGISFEIDAGNHFNYYGWSKYAMALSGSLAFIILLVRIKLLLLLPLSIIVFYLIESQFIFLFPILIDNKPNPFSASILMTQRAGGTIRVIFILIPIAAYMVIGGLLGKGIVRSWCIGCLAIILWYESLRNLK